jgi:hypothetical protein
MPGSLRWREMTASLRSPRDDIERCAMVIEITVGATRERAKFSVRNLPTTLRSRSSQLDRDRCDPELADARRASGLSALRRIVLDPEALTRVEARGDAMRSIVVYTSGWASMP